MYSREAIFEHMLTKTQELKRQQALYDAQEAKKLAAEVEGLEARGAEEASRFVSSQLALAVTSRAESAAPATKKRKAAAAAEEGDAERASTVAKLSSEVGDRVTKAQLKGTAYWLPQFQPEHRVAPIKEPPKRPGSPNTGQPLRLKDLHPVALKLDVDTADVHEKRYQCALSDKQITFQDTVLLKKSNKVVLSSIYRDLVKPTMTCPFSGGKLKEKDVLKLVKPGSSFASAGSVKVKVYGHTIT